MPARRNLRGVGLHAQRRRGLSKLKKTAPVGTLQKTGLELRRVIIKEVRGHFVKCRFYSTQERLSIGDYGWEWRLEQKVRAFARSEPVGRPVPCGVAKSLARIRNFYVAGKHSLDDRHLKTGRSR